MSQELPLREFGREEPLPRAAEEDLAPLPDGCPDPAPPAPQAAWLAKYDFSLDGFSALGLPIPKTKEQEDALVAAFLRGLEKLFQNRDNWTFLQPLALSTEYCMRCNTCNDACMIYQSSGQQDVYRPNFRSELLRRIRKRYFTPAGKLLGRWVGADVELNWQVVYRIAELAYRCTLCRRCAATCPIGVDNALLARELRKIFSQEMGIAPDAIDKSGARKQLAMGASSGMNPAAFRDTLEFIEDLIGEKTGRKIRIPVDRKGAKILLVHNTGEYLAWPENPAAFAILFDAAGIDYTLSSEAMGYEATNYGVWYDDGQFAQITMAQLQAARQLGAQKIVVGECGHATKALVTIADRIAVGENHIPRESCLPLLEQIVLEGRVKFDRSKNDFPVTLHDPCNLVRLMGIVTPQRTILDRVLAPGRYREMRPSAEENYCCGGGSGMAILHGLGFDAWRDRIAARQKARQVLEAFADCLDPSIPKYYCAPCSNCKGTARDSLLKHYGFRDRYNIIYGGLVELMVNALPDLPQPYISWTEEF